MKSIVIILAGGKGSRISASEYKQYIDVNGRTILEHTLIKFKQAFNKKNTIIVIPQLQKKSDLLKIYNKFTSHNLVYGGISRKESVESALRYINELEEKP
jgi:2-C-methyl-D-erythritol 4-phosphate cytidylyltransferase